MKTVVATNETHIIMALISFRFTSMDGNWHFVCTIIYCDNFTYNFVKRVNGMGKDKL